MNTTTQTSTIKSSTSKKRLNAEIAIVGAAWHSEIVGELVNHCAATLEASSHQFTVTRFEVAGVVEIPLFTQKLIALDRFDAVIVAGLIADHGVYRHDFVASTVMDATMTLQMQTGVPIIYAILTPQEFLSEGREAFFAEHFKKKGVEAANACVRTLKNDELLSEMSVQIKAAG